MKNRVVITGLGAVTPNAIGVEAYNQALQYGKSGIKHWPELADIGFKSQIGGKPDVTQEYKDEHLPNFLAKKIQNNAVIYGCLAGLEAWKDADLEVNLGKYNRKTGLIAGSGALGLDSFIEHKIYPIDQGNHRKLGSRSVTESMSSGIGAYLNSMLGLTGRIISNSSACITGSEAVLHGFELIQSGRMERMLCASAEGDGKYIWGGFDAMRVLCSDSNENPEEGSRPMSGTSSGFVPSGGGGALVLESLEAATARGAKIYAEILGAEVNSGGQTNGGSMTAQNPEAVVDCIHVAMERAGISAQEVDLISGHLTSTKGDPAEVENWSTALQRSGDDFPYINTPKSMIGHCVAAAGTLELVACTLQLSHGYIHPNINLKDIHPDILKYVNPEKIPTKLIHKPIDVVIKSNFGFGDLNCVVVLRKWK